MVLSPYLLSTVGGPHDGPSGDKEAAELCQRAAALLARGDAMAALRAYVSAIHTDAAAAEAWTQFGDALQAAGKIELSAICQRNALIYDKSAWQHLRYGNALSSLLRFEEAEAQYRRCNLLDDGLSKSWYGLAYLKMMAGKTDEARVYIDRALALDPDVPDVRYLSAVLAISVGDWKRGFGEDYDDGRFALQLRDKGGCNRPANIPLWQGEPLDGRHLYLYSEQGFGDILLYLRFVQRLPKCHLSFMVPKEMRRLIEYSFAGKRLIDYYNAGTTIPKADYCLPLASIPRRLIEAGQNFSIESEPYIRSPDGYALRRPLNVRKTVGVVWAGDPKHSNDRWRSASAEDFVVGLARPGIELYSLQVGPQEIDSALLGDVGLMQHATAHVTDWYDTAAIVKQLDCVVSVDTAVANLCGAMGKECHVLVPYGGIDWRWMHDCDRSPWYPSVRIYRQSKNESWRQVLERIEL